jgi:hypothetical protein
VSQRLTRFENHRTQSDFENARIAKLFSFKFINSYNSLFYIAFIKTYVDTTGCEDDPSCMGFLQVQMASLFVSLSVVSNLVEFFLVKFKIWSSAKKESAFRVVTDANGEDREIEIVRTDAERQFECVYKEGNFEDMAEVVIQYGYVILFVVAFPAAPACALVANVMEWQIDATRLTCLQRRPQPAGAQNIGQWLFMLRLLGYIAILNNIALIIVSPRIHNTLVL